MAIRVVSSGGSGSPGAGISLLAGPESPPLLADQEKLHLPNWFPSRISLGGEDDTLLVTNARDEREVLDDGGMLNGNPLTYLSPTATKATLSTGRFRNSVLFVTSEGSASWPINLPLDQWTIECWVNPGATALDAISSGTVWKISTSLQTVTLSWATTTLTAKIECDERAFTPAGSLNAITANCTMTAGDVAASGFTVISVTFKSTIANGLKVIVGNNVRSGTSTNSANPAWLKRPFCGDPRAAGFMVVGHDRLTGGGAGSGIKVSDTIVRRYQRTYGANHQIEDAPTITVDAGTTVTDSFTGTTTWKEKLGGVVMHYSWWARNETDEAGGAAIREAQLDLMEDLGGKHVRIAEFHERAVPTIAAGAITGISYTGLDAHWDRASSRGFKVHCHVGYTPTAFGGGASGNVPPNVSGLTEAQAFALYADYVSQVFAHLKARYGTSLIQTISFWNEPSLSGFWTGTQAQLFDLWEAVATKHATDHPDLPKIGGLDEIFNAASTGTSESNQRGLIARSQTAASALVRPLPHLSLHQYLKGCLTRIGESYDDLRAYANANGNTTAAIQVGEWGDINSAYDGTGTGQAILSQDQRTQNEWMPGYIHAFLYWAYQAGINAAYFFRLGQQATVGSEISMGLISNTGRPWPALSAMALWWKHSGNRASATSNWPTWTALASKSTGNVITLTYGSFDPYQRARKRKVQFDWAGLPSTFTWEQWRVDGTTLHDSRPHLVGRGDQTNLPLGAELTGCGVGAVQITPE